MGTDVLGLGQFQNNINRLTGNQQQPTHNNTGFQQIRQSGNNNSQGSMFDLQPTHNNTGFQQMRQSGNNNSQGNLWRQQPSYGNNSSQQGNVYMQQLTKQSCPKCTFEMSTELSECPVCEHKFPENANQLPTVSGNTENCPNCTYGNNTGNKKCEVCEHPLLESGNYDIIIARRFFDLFDFNGDGSINKDELEILFRNLPVQYTDISGMYNLDTIFNKADTDNNNEIDFGEFQNMLQEFNTFLKQGNDHSFITFIRRSVALVNKIQNTPVSTIIHPTSLDLKTRVPRTQRTYEDLMNSFFHDSGQRVASGNSTTCFDVHNAGKVVHDPALGFAILKQT